MNMMPHRPCFVQPHGCVAPVAAKGPRLQVRRPERLFAAHRCEFAPIGGKTKCTEWQCRESEQTGSAQKKRKENVRARGSAGVRRLARLAELTDRPTPCGKSRRGEPFGSHGRANSSTYWSVKRNIVGNVLRGQEQALLLGVILSRGGRRFSSADPCRRGEESCNNSG